MTTPTRFPGGFTQAATFQALRNMGSEDPFYYHQFADDFDGNNANAYTETITTAGTIANTPADGGALLFTTNATTPLATDIAAIQLKAASFTYTQGKKLFYYTRVASGGVANPAWLVGMIQTTATPFTVVNGIYFSKATGSTTINLITVVASVATTTPLTTLSTAFGTASAGASLDLSFEVSANGDVVVSAGINVSLTGAVLQSGTGANTPAFLCLTQCITGLTLPTAILNPTIALQSGTAASQTLQADFMLAAKER
jgi:hypothetical protein